MTPEAASLVGIAVALGSDDVLGLERALRDSIGVASPEAVDEALLQSYLFVGFPRVLNAFSRWRAMSPVSPPEGPEEGPLVVADEAGYEARGIEVLGTVYGDQRDRVIENAKALHPDLGRWMVVEGYGKVLGRSGLDLGVRELCIIALLATQDAVPQLYSHLRGALNAGMTESDVEETLTRALTRVSGERSMRAREAWETVRSRRGG